MPRDLLLEIGCEELPSSFVTAALAALPELLTSELAERRLAHGEVWTAGTPRRLAAVVHDVADVQTDVDEQVTGPPVRVAFRDGEPTKAATSFATKVGVDVSALTTVETDKGEYVAARRVERGAPAMELLPELLQRACARIPFRKSMRWGDGDTAFGRPVRWLLALLGSEPVAFEFAGARSGRCSFGHRFLAPERIEIGAPGDYVGALERAHVVVDVERRAQLMMDRLREAAREAGGTLIEDEFLVGENLHLVEDPFVIAGGFDERFLELPERVVLDVAKDHQRYFGLRGADNRLLARYLAVVNTARVPANVRLGNDRVMRARLADAKFFWDEDQKRPLESRCAELDGVVFQKKLGSVGDKVRRLEALVPRLGAELGLSSDVIATAARGAGLCKCDLVTLMVFEFPELQGEMGRAYAVNQGVEHDVAETIAEHYKPRGADDETASSDAAALLAVADRLDTLAGCFAIGVVPTGTADPLALRRASLGVLRTVLDRGWDLSLDAAGRAARAGYAELKEAADADETVKKLNEFFAGRLRGVLAEELPADVVDACLSAAADRPTDVRQRAAALAGLSAETRSAAAEVFKRAANISKNAPDGAPEEPSSVGAVEPAEATLYAAFTQLEARLDEHASAGDYAAAFAEVGEFAPVLGTFFDEVLVNADDDAVRDNRLRLMAAVHGRCSRLANFRLLAQ